MILRTLPSQRANKLNQSCYRSYSTENSPFVYFSTGRPIYYDTSHFSHSITSSLCISTRLLLLVVLVFVACTGCTSKSQILDRIKSSGTLRIAIDPSFAPFDFVNDENNVAGFDVDLATHIADALDVQAQFVTTGYDALYDALTVGRADIIISALYPNPSHTQTFIYSTPYFDAGDVLVVANNSPITSWESLEDKRVACIFGTAGHITALGWQQTITPQPILITANSPHTLTQALVNGALDAIILDHVTALKAAGDETSIQILPMMITEEPYVVAARLEDRVLIKVIDSIIDEMRVDGTLQRLINQWMR